ncbi:MAG: hypothetical protein BM564_08815 [Bacteroidetes bacterium MedPE-SWsnd-G2]|nr:MAG: hypothetical protein BM564_08815 [Bacteroidetes bacterium MedPE-SWsnd-G2]
MNSIKKNLAFFLLAVTLIIFSQNSFAQNDEQDLTPEQMEALAKAMDNPLSQIWSLAFQYNQAWIGNNVLDKSNTGNVLSFQPILPIPINDDLMFFARPVLNLITIPKPDLMSPDFFNGHDTGFGDMIFALGIGPQKSEGLLYGGGASFIFPTSSEPIYGSGKYQVGPALMLFYLKKKFLGGVLAQQWWSFAGHDDREKTNHASFLCYFIYNLENNWQLRYNPNITVDWTADGEKLYLPIGLGVGKLTKLGKMPVKFVLEGQYGLISPNLLAPVGTLPIPGIVNAEASVDWLVRFQVNFVIPNPFGDINKILNMNDQ